MFTLGPVRPEVIPAATVMRVRVEATLSSRERRKGNSFVVSTMERTRRGEREVLGAGHRITGLVEAVNRTKRFNQMGSLTLEFDGIEVAPDLAAPGALLSGRSQDDEKAWNGLQEDVFLPCTGETGEEPGGS